MTGIELNEDNPFLSLSQGIHHKQKQIWPRMLKIENNEH